MADADERRRKPPRPQPSRMPDTYGISQTPRAAASLWDAVVEQLTRARNYWVGTTQPDGRPHTVPVWGIWADDAFYFSTDPASRKGRNLAANPALVVHLESGDDVVILEGTAERVTDADRLAPFVAAYAAKYGIRVDVSNPAYGVYRCAPQAALTWSEPDFPQTATRWSFAGQADDPAPDDA